MKGICLSFHIILTHCLPVLLLIIHFTECTAFSFQRTFSFNAAFLELGAPIQTKDAGYLFTGSLNNDIVLLKTDSSGSQNWCKQFNIGQIDRGQSIITDFEENIVIAGTTYFQNGPLIGDICVIKTDSTGNLIWSKLLGGSDSESPVSILLSADSGYIVVANSSSFNGSGNGEIYIIKLDSNGNKIWSTVIVKSTGLNVHSAKGTMDGGFILAGTTGSSASILLVKMDSDGVVQWNKNYKRLQNDWGYDVIETSDTCFIILGMTMNGTACTLFKTDSAGIVQWSSELSGSNNSVIGYDLINGLGDSFHIAGELADTTTSGFILTFNAAGNIVNSGRINCAITQFLNNIIGLAI